MARRPKTKPRLGRLRSVDYRDWNYLLPRREAKRNSKHWRLSRVLDQGDTPQCVGYAFAAWFMSEPVRQLPLLPTGIWRFAQHEDEWPGTSDDEGTSVRAACKALVWTGHIKAYKWALDAETVVNHILNIGPIVLGTDWRTGMYQPDEDGYLSLSGRLVGGHAYLAYGANIKSGYISIRNSWGKSWGKNGTARIRLDDLDYLMDQNGEACAAVDTRVK